MPSRVQRPGRANPQFGNLAVGRSHAGEGGEGGWTSSRVHFAEAEPQWNTKGANLGATYGPGTDDTAAYPLEKNPARSSMTEQTDYWTHGHALGRPWRLAMCVSNEHQIYEDFAPYRAHRILGIGNEDDGSVNQVYAGLWLSNGTEMISEGEWGSVVLVHDVPADDTAIALIDPDTEVSVALAFEQRAGVVTCHVLEVPPIPRNEMNTDHVFGDDFPVGVDTIVVGAATQVATGGRAPDTAGWVTFNLTSDVVFSSLQAVHIGNGRVLLLHLKSTGAVDALVLTCVAGVVTVESTTTILASSVAQNIYQAVTSDNGLVGGTETRLAFSYRGTGAANGGAVILDVDDANVVTIHSQTTFGVDYSHVAWCGERIIMLTKPGYSATFGANTVGFGVSQINLNVYDLEFNLISTTNGSEGVVGGIMQPATVYGWEDGRLFMFAAGCEPEEIPTQVYEYYGSGIRLYTLEGDQLRLQDQQGEVNNVNPAAQEVHRIGGTHGQDTLLQAGRQQELWSSNPASVPFGGSHPMFKLMFVGGSLKECNADLHIFRISDEWLITIEPEKVGNWFTAPGAPIWDSAPLDGYFFESTYARASHVNAAGVIDIIGEPLHLMIHDSYYSGVAPITGTQFMHVSEGWLGSQAQDAMDTMIPRFHMTIIDIDPDTGNLSVAARRPLPGTGGNDGKIFRAFAPGTQLVSDAGGGIIFNEVDGPYDGISMLDSRTVLCEAGTWELLVAVGISVSDSGTIVVNAYDLNDDTLIRTISQTGIISSSAIGSGLSFRVKHDAPFKVEVRIIGVATPGLTVISRTRISAREGDTIFVADILPVEENSNRYLMMHRVYTDPNAGSSLSNHSVSVTTFDLDVADYSTTILDRVAVDTESGGGAFTERKPDGLIRLNPNQFVATYPWTDSSGSHWSAHNGIIVGANGELTVGTPLRKVDETESDPFWTGTGHYGFQGFWMHRGVANHGKYIYPCGDEWVHSHLRFPPHILTESSATLQDQPFAVAVMEIDPVTGQLTATFYPLRVNPADVDLEWYEANNFFAPNTSPNDTSTAAHPDGYQYHFYNTSSVLPGSHEGEFWLYQGPEPVPFAEGLLGGFGVAKYVLNEDNQSADYVIDSFDVLGLCYFLGYSNHSIPLRDGMTACMASFSYHCRAGAVGYNGGFGSGIIRIFEATEGRGQGTPGDDHKRVHRYGERAPF